MKSRALVTKVVSLLVTCSMLLVLVSGIGAQARTKESSDLQTSSSVMFIENVGQFPEGARFQVRGGMGTMWLTEDAIWISLVKSSSVDALEHFDVERSNVEQKDEPRRGVNLKLSFTGANPHPRLESFDRLDTVVSYFIGNEPDKWCPDVPVWGGVRYVDLYPDIDLEITSQNDRWTWRVVASDGAELSQVRLRVEGANALASDGDALNVTTAVGDFTLPLLHIIAPDGTPLDLMAVRPEVNGTEVTSPFSFTSTPPLPALLQDNPDDLLYSTFLGGSNWEWGYGIAVDEGGSAYVTGYTYSSDFPTTAGAFDTTYNLRSDAFVVKMNTDGTGLIYATFLGGSSDEWGSDCTIVDGAGSVYVTGSTKSSDFPSTQGAFDTTHNGDADAFVVKLNAAGTGLIYATFLGGSDSDTGYAIDVDGAGNAYVTGRTESSDFPTTPGAFDTSHNGGWADVFVVKLNASSTDLAYATFLGGGDEDRGYGIAVEGSGNVYVAGKTGSSDFPTTPDAFDTSHNGNYDAFVVKMNAAGTDLAYATFLGGSHIEEGYAITVDEGDSAYVMGTTYSSDFPTTAGAFDTSFNLPNDAFVVKMNTDGTGLIYATFLGGSNSEWGYGIAVDEGGSAYVTGYTYSSDFPTTAGAFDTSHNLYRDAFVVKMNTDGTGLIYATFLGGSNSEWGYGIAVDGEGSAYVTGHTWSSDFPTTAGAYDTSHNGGGDAFVAKLAMGGEPGPTKPLVVLVHGFNGSCVDWSYNDSFKHLEEWLRNDGYDVHCAHPFANSDFAPPLAVNARKLAADITEIKSRTGADEVIIIAHSLGGIIARAYIESSLYQNDVAWFYVLGSPNGGSWLATEGIVFTCFDIYKSGALCEITIKGMETFNSLHWSKRPEELPYRLIAGTGQNRTPRGKALGQLIPGPDDATISVASVHALDGDALVKYTSTETHSSELGEPSYFDPDSGSQSYRECIDPELLDTGTCPQRVLSASRMAAEVESILNSPIASFTGVITTGFTISHTVAVDTSGAGSFNLLWISGDLAFNLTTPTGAVIDPAYAQTSADVEYGQVPITDSITAAATYYITNTIPGTWILTVSGVDTGAESVLYGVNVVVESDVLLNTDSDRDLYTISDTAVVTASLTAGGTGVSGANVQATIHRPDSVAETIFLYDDGAHSDGAAGDGLYGGSYTVAVSGYHAFRASAEGTVGDEAFRREVQDIFIVASEAASLTGSYTDYPVDEDGDSRYEWLALDMGIDVNRAGDYTLSAQLRGDDDSFVSHVLTYTTFITDTQTVTVYFAGEDILKSGVDGPYTVTEIYLMDDSNASIPADIEMDVWITDVYDYTQFGRTTITGDLNGDCVVNVVDIMLVASQWRCKCGDECYHVLYDMDGDCDIDVVDIMLVVVHWGETCE